MLSMYTWGHEEGYSESAWEDSIPESLQAGPVKGQRTAHQHIQHHTQALKNKNKSCDPVSLNMY